MDWSKPPSQSPKSDKTDTGFQLAYFKLSHRRKFWRTIYFAPLSLVFFFIPQVFGVPGWAFGILCLVLSAAQAGYEYVKWQDDERNGLYSKAPPAL